MNSEEIVLNDLMGYPEGPKIFQDPKMFHFSIDSMLLGSFVSVSRKTKNIVDLCTGNAPIPLYLTLRCNANIDCVEIQEKAYLLAEKTIQYNQLENQIHVYHGNLKGIHEVLGTQKYDVVTVNPPYFKAQADPHYNKNEYLTIARHEIHATLEDVIQEAFLLLNNGGNIAMVHRPDRLLDVLESLRRNHFEPKRIQFIYPRRGSQAMNFLIEAKKNGNPGGCKILSPLYVYNGSKWTKDVLKIYNYKKEEQSYAIK